MRTYVVRLAELAPAPPDEEPVQPTLRGVVDDVRTGERTPFRSAEELMSLLAPPCPLVDSPREHPGEH